MTELEDIHRLMDKPAEKSVRSAQRITRRITFFAGTIATVFLIYLLVIAIFALA